MRRSAVVKILILVVGLAVFALFAAPAAAADDDSGTETNQSQLSDRSHMDGYGPSDGSDALTASDVNCMSCHEFQPTNRTERPVNVPDPKHPSLEHGDGRYWCLKCHASENRNKLELANGTNVDFGPENSSKVCAGCHGPTYKDWEEHIHGKWVGSWQNATTNKYCVDCHNPHDPSFDTLTPEKPPEGPPPTDRAGLILPSYYHIAASIVLILAILIIGYAAWPPDLQ